MTTDNQEPAMDENELAFAQGAAELHNSVVALGEAYRQFIDRADQARKRAFDEGGQLGVEDFVSQAGRSRIDSDLCGLMVAVGLGTVLVASNGRADHRPNPNFGARYARLVKGGGLVSHRGRHPNPDPLSGFRAPGVKVEETKPRSVIRSKGSVI